MRVTIDDDTQDMIDEMLKDCHNCKFLGRCPAPYHNRAELIKAAMMKFHSMDCDYPPMED